MASLIDTVLGQLGGGGLGTIASTLGLGGEGEAKSAVTSAVSVLTGALAHNSSEPDGARALDSALEKDHDGSIFDNIGGFLGDFASGPGAGILGHVFGGSQPQVQQAVAEKSGLSLDKVVPLLTMVAPLVMGALGKKKKENEMSADQVAADLAAERAEAEKKDDNNLLGSVLGMLGGMGGGGGATSSSSGGGGLGGLLGTLGGLFGKKKKGS